MQAVILAAGKGTRMGGSTNDFPKALLEYKDKTLLHWKLEVIPKQIEEIIIVVGHHGKLIRDKIGNSYKDKKVVYVEENEAKGTGFALWKTKEILGDRFLVLMGDDIYSAESLREAAKYDWSITVKKVPRENSSSRVILDGGGKLLSFVSDEKYRKIGDLNSLAFTGLYSLRRQIFDYPLVKMETKDEWGLPHTLLQATPDIDLKILETDFWIPISTPEDLRS